MRGYPYIEYPLIVGATGFEPATAWSQTRSATGLRYTPIRLIGISPTLFYAYKSIQFTWVLQILNLLFYNPLFYSVILSAIYR